MRTTILNMFMGFFLLMTSHLFSSDWKKVSERNDVVRRAPQVVWASDIQKMVVFGGRVMSKGTPFVQLFDPKTNQWENYSNEKPGVRRPDEFNVTFKTAYDAKAKIVYALNWFDNGPWGELFYFDMTSKKWGKHPVDPLFTGLSWCAMTIDQKRNRLVVIGSDKLNENVGHTRTIFFDLKTKNWSKMKLPEKEILEKHQKQQAIADEVYLLIGLTRTAWYRASDGKGKEAELVNIKSRATALMTNNLASVVKSDLVLFSKEVGSNNLLIALKIIKKVIRKYEDFIDEGYPVPKGRRASPLAYVSKADRIYLFGGDHADYLMNDTWYLDLEKEVWVRCKNKLAPSPRTGHSIVYLKKSHHLMIMDGYSWQKETNYRKLPQEEIWLFDIAKEEWKLRSVSPWTAERFSQSFVYSYGREQNAAPAIVATEDDTVIFESISTGKGALRPHWYHVKAQPARTFVLDIKDVHQRSSEEKKYLARANSRKIRELYFRTDFSEIPDKPKQVDLKKIPANKWFKMPAPPRNICVVRKRDWSTVIWDDQQDQLLLWGGGHSVASANSVVHYSPVSNRMVEGYESEEPYSRMGYGGYQSTIMNHPWIPAHTYRLHAWDSINNVMIFGYVNNYYIYHPQKMQWSKKIKSGLPYIANYNNTLTGTTPHGIIAWCKNELWLMDTKKGLDSIQFKKLATFPTGCGVDRDGMVYDSKRDRMVFYTTHSLKNRIGDGSMFAYEFKTGKTIQLVVKNKALGQMLYCREIVYVADMDMYLFSEPYGKRYSLKSEQYFSAYDCKTKKWVLLDLGSGPDSGPLQLGLVYDSKRKLVYAMTKNGGVWMLRFDRSQLKYLEKPPIPASKIR